MAKRIKVFGATVLSVACIWVVVVGIFLLGNWLATTLIANNTWVGMTAGGLLLLVFVGLIEAWKVK